MVDFELVDFNSVYFDLVDFDLVDFEVLRDNIQGLDTVVLDLDHTLVVTKKMEDVNLEKIKYEYTVKNISRRERVIVKRPGLDQFIKELENMNLRLVLFTSSGKNYAKEVTKHLKCKKSFHKAFYKQNCEPNENKENTEFKIIKNTDICLIDGNYLIVDDKLAYHKDQNDLLIKIPQFDIFKEGDNALFIVLKYIKMINDKELILQEGIKKCNEMFNLPNISN